MKRYIVLTVASLTLNVCGSETQSATSSHSAFTPYTSLAKPHAAKRADTPRPAFNCGSFSSFPLSSPANLASYRSLRVESKQSQSSTQEGLDSRPNSPMQTSPTHTLLSAPSLLMSEPEYIRMLAAVQHFKRADTPRPDSTTSSSSTFPVPLSPITREEFLAQCERSRSFA